MTPKERLIAFKRDLGRCEKTESASASRIRDLMLDNDCEKIKWAENFVLKSFGIPATYFRRVAENHQLEVMDNAVRTYPDKRVNILIEHDKLIAAGPDETMAFEDIGNYILDSEDEDYFISGDMFENGASIIYNILGELDSGYKVGLCIHTSTLFNKGMSVQPLIFEVLCENGMVDAIDAGVKLKLKSGECVDRIVDEVMFLATEILNKREKKYKNILEDLDGMKPIQSENLLDVMVSMNLPQSYREKAINNTIAIEEGTLKTAVLPSAIDTRRDNLSILTYTAQGFNPHTRQRIEENIFVGMPIFQKAA